MSSLMWRPTIQEAHAQVFERQLAGRELRLERSLGRPDWHWSVFSHCGRLLAEGSAATKSGAEDAATSEATALHPPSPAWLDEMAGGR